MTAAPTRADVERYDMELGCDTSAPGLPIYFVDDQKSPRGDWVRATDYDALLSREAQLRRALEGMVPDGIEQCCDECGGDPAKCATEQPNCVVRVARAALNTRSTT